MRQSLKLLLARSAARQKEMEIRTALGAGRRRLLAQAMTEGMLISWGGAGLGLLLAVAGTRTLSRLDAISVPLLREVRIDTAALGFAVVVAIAAGVIFGLAAYLPARRASRVDPMVALRAD